MKDIRLDFCSFVLYFHNLSLHLIYTPRITNALLIFLLESTLLIHYLRKHSHSDSFDVEIECLAKAGRSPNITWYRSDDGDHFTVVYPSSAESAVFESSPNRYRLRSLLMVRGLSFSSDATFVCEALDGRTGGAVSKFVTIPKRKL